MRSPRLLNKEALQAGQEAQGATGEQEQTTPPEHMFMESADAEDAAASETEKCWADAVLGLLSRIVGLDPSQSDGWAPVHAEAAALLVEQRIAALAD